MRLTDMTLPSGRKLAFRWDGKEFTCDLFIDCYERQDEWLAGGLGRNRLDALKGLFSELKRHKICDHNDELANLLAEVNPDADQVLPSGRKLRYSEGGTVCQLISSISDNVLCSGKGANRLDALHACAIKAYETGYRHDAIRHVRYWQKLWIELRGLWKQVKPAPKPRPQADPWQVVR